MNCSFEVFTLQFQAKLFNFWLICIFKHSVLLITSDAELWSEVRFNVHVLLMLFQDKADRRPVPEWVRGKEQNLPPTGAAKQVATPTAHAHTNRSWLWVSFWG